MGYLEQVLLQHIDHKLDRMVDMLNQILKKEKDIMSAVDDALTQAEAAAKATTDQEDVIIGILTTVTKLINDLKAGADPATVARITALASALDAKKDALAAAGAATPTS
jgi:hypothetical protein